MTVTPANANAAALPDLINRAQALIAANGGGGAATAANAAAPAGQTATDLLGTKISSTVFQDIDKEQINIALDPNGGLATGLANLSRLFAGRQERVNRLSKALAIDANKNGQLNGVDVQKLSTETETMRQMSDLQKKIFDAVTQSIQGWLR